LNYLGMVGTRGIEPALNHVISVASATS